MRQKEEGNQWTDMMKKRKVSVMYLITREEWGVHSVGATLHWKWKIGSVTVQVEHRRNRLVPPLEPYVDTEATESIHFWCTQRCTQMFVHVKRHVQSLHRDNEVPKRAWWWVLLFLSKWIHWRINPANICLFESRERRRRRGQRPAVQLFVVYLLHQMSHLFSLCPCKCNLQLFYLRLCIDSVMWSAFGLNSWRRRARGRTSSENIPKRSSNPAGTFNVSFVQSGSWCNRK